MIERNSIWTLKGIAGEFQGNTLPLSEEEITVGRTSKNHVIINDHNISRTHVTFFVNADDVFIQDEGSRNGTLVNEQKLAPGSKIKLQHGDRILIGQHAFVVELVEKIDPEELKKASQAAREAAVFKNEPTRDNDISPFVGQMDWKEKLQSFSISKMQLNRRTMMYGVMGIVILGVVISKMSGDGTAKNPLAGKDPQIEIKTENFISDKNETLDAGDLDALKVKAKAALQFQDYLAATELYEKIIKADPKNDYIVSQFDFAKKQLAKAIAQHLEFAKREYEKLNYERAIIEWKQVLALTVKANPDVYKQTVQKISDTEKEMRKRR